MKPTVVSDILAVGEVPAPGQLEILAKAGFKSVINCQPDGEVDRFPGSTAFSADATRAGLGYVYAPIVSRTPSDEELAVFQQALRRLPSPIYAFCYSGDRSAAAAAFVETEGREPATIIADFSAAGFDIQSLKPWLDDQRQRRKATASANGGNGVSLPEPTIAAALELKSIVVHARAAGASGFAV